eukprot:scaffold5397_cov126-Skeletonema_marinoi.AAC.9
MQFTRRPNNVPLEVGGVVLHSKMRSLVGSGSQHTADVFVFTQENTEALSTRQECREKSGIQE